MLLGAFSHNLYRCGSRQLSAVCQVFNSITSSSMCIVLSMPQSSGISNCPAMCQLNWQALTIALNDC